MDTLFSTRCVEGLRGYKRITNFCFPYSRSFGNVPTPQNKVIGSLDKIVPSVSTFLSVKFLVSSFKFKVSAFAGLDYRPPLSKLFRRSWTALIWPLANLLSFMKPLYNMHQSEYVDIINSSLIVAIMVFTSPAVQNVNNSLLIPVMELLGVLVLFYGYASNNPFKML